MKSETGILSTCSVGLYRPHRRQFLVLKSTVDQISLKKEMTVGNGDLCKVIC
jgi:hypothetical protein